MKISRYTCTVYYMYVHNYYLINVDRKRTIIRDPKAAVFVMYTCYNNNYYDATQTHNAGVGSNQVLSYDSVDNDATQAPAL